MQPDDRVCIDFETCRHLMYLEGFKFFVAVDYLTGALLRNNLDAGVVSSKSCEHLEWGATGQYFLELLRDLPGRG